jgi:HlyD family secretion protein
MDMKVTEARTEAAPARTVVMPPAPEPPPKAPKRSSSDRIPAIIVAVVIAAVATLSIWYLVRGEPLLVQGEVDATRFDIAARVDGRVGKIPVARGENVAANAVLVRIDNPETLAKHEQALAAKVVADAQLANINVGTRPEVIAARKAALDRGAGGCRAGAEDLRTRPPVGGARQCTASAARPGDRQSA